MKFTRLRGMQDIVGPEAVLFETIENAAREVFKIFGFSEIRTPVMEDRELFKRALGTETDVVQKEMYEFEDRSKSQVALRPEGTAGVVRAYLENGFDKTEGLSKLFYIGPMFRSERPQAGRLRQFHQIGAEALGVDSPYADVEMIHCLATFFDKVGASGYQIRLNNLGTFEERQEYRKVLKDYFVPLKESLCEDCKNRLEKNIFRILDCKNETCRVLILKAPLINGFLTQNSKDHFSKVCRGLDALGVRYTLDSFMVRGLDYYTKTVFEISHSKLGAQDALAAGGRYDHLIESFGGPALGAVGFALGVERLFMCVQALGAAQNNPPRMFFIVTLGEAAFEEGFKRLGALRQNGFNAGMDFSAKSMKAQMRGADKSLSGHVIILGDDELKKNVFVLKDMKKGSQETYPLDNFLEICRNVK